MGDKTKNLKASLFYIVVCLFVIQSASAVTVTSEKISANTQNIWIVGVDDMYAYEVTMEYDGTYYEVNNKAFLVRNGTTEKDCSDSNETADNCTNGDSVYGTSVKDGLLYVYGSRLDNTATGIDGTGILFEVTSDAALPLYQVLIILNTTEELYLSFNATGEVIKPAFVLDSPDEALPIITNETANETESTSGIENATDNDEGLTEREIWMILIGSFVVLLIILIVAAYIITNSGKKKNAQQNTQYPRYTQQSEIYYRR